MRSYILFLILVSVSCDNSNQDTITLDKEVVNSNCLDKIVDYIIEQKIQVETPLCVSNTIITPNYLAFEALIDCSTVDTTSIVGKIYYGFDCESQYVHNLQHSYSNTWDIDIKSHAFELVPCLRDSKSTVYFSDYQNSHLYAVMVNNYDIINDESYILDYMIATEFMFKIDGGGDVAWMKVIPAESMIPPEDQ